MRTAKRQQQLEEQEVGCSPLSGDRARTQCRWRKHGAMTCPLRTMRKLYNVQVSVLARALLV